MYRWVFSWRMFRVYLFLAICLATLIGLFYGVENWRGARARQAYAEQTRTRPGPRTWQEIIPPPVPDSDNFAMTPFLAPLFDYIHTSGPDKNRVRDTNAFSRAQGFAKAFPNISNIHRWQSARAVDLAEWLDDYHKAIEKRDGKTDGHVSANATNAAQVAAAVLEALKPVDGILDELKSASLRPKSRFNLRYDEENPWGILIPHLAVLRNAAQLNQMRALAELRLNQPDKALEDLKFSLRLADSMRDEPFVISQLVGISIVHHTLQIVWEGCLGRRWSAEQLESIEESLSRLNFLAAVDRSLAAERIASFITIDQLRNGPNRAELWAALGIGDAPLISLFPNGWLDLEFVNVNRWLDEMGAALDAPGKRIHSQLSDNAQKHFEKSSAPGPSALFRHELMSRALVPGITDVLTKVAHAQNSVAIARIACALERYRQADGHYPPTLNELVPRYLAVMPIDVLTGEPFHYRRSANDHFVLYSVGWNGKDDGGAIPTAKKGTSRNDLREGDWVWEYPVSKG
jgi:tetratricopeptide (TPR) repeat protein